MLTHRPKLTENELQLVEESFTPTNRKPNCLFIFGELISEAFGLADSINRILYKLILWFCLSAIGWRFPYDSISWKNRSAKPSPIISPPKQQSSEKMSDANKNSETKS